MRICSIYRLDALNNIVHGKIDYSERAIRNRLVFFSVDMPIYKHLPSERIYTST